ncbi:hypothetical protein BDW59DRAFT_155253 [Aspergillus cavernicola]|uniref:Peptidase M43 pregnancy-associated plasma-A domain-containing protein n=1 Tax=Aspergillus cavernicola TaxID=176166 RepID=A0ABR4HAY3_9EURO
MRVLSVLLGLSALAAARCGTGNPSDNVKAHHKAFQDKEDREAARSATRDVFEATIDTYVHVILTNSTHGNSSSLPDQISEQIDVLNENYQKTGFSFNLVNVSYTRNNRWQAITDGSTTEYEVKSTLRRGDYTALNLYYGTIGGGILGYATFPDDVSEQGFQVDGVVCDPQTLPGGEAPYDLGITAVHEVGHWLNLFHTFQPGNDDPEIPGCFGHGDYIHDTPAEGFAAFGCPKRRDTCKGTDESNNDFSVPGDDPIHNFMDYTDDICLTQFTAGQIRRMQSSWTEERAGYVPSGSRVSSRRARPGSGWGGSGV